MRDVSHGKSDERSIGPHFSDLAAIMVHHTGRYIATRSSYCVNIFEEEQKMVKMKTHHTLACSVAAALRLKWKVCLDFSFTLSIQHKSSLLTGERTNGLMILYGQRLS